MVDGSSRNEGGPDLLTSSRTTTSGDGVSTFVLGERCRIDERLPRSLIWSIPLTNSPTTLFLPVPSPRVEG